MLALSLGASAAYSILRIIERTTRGTTLSSQTATINASASDRPWFDLAFQLLGIAVGIAPVALVIFLCWRIRPPHLARLGFGAPMRVESLRQRVRRLAREWSGGLALAAVIGVPGLGLYVAAKSLGLNTTVVPTALDTYWWTTPVLILAALEAALVEEIIVIAYLFERLRRLGVGPWAIILSSALLRGSYHLYQGFGGFIGNVAMGVVFGWVYRRWGRSTPLVVAHFLLDVVSFAGYALAVAWWPDVFAAPTT